MTEPLVDDVVLRRTPAFVGVVGSITGLNVVILALTLISSPLQARVLGPEGRGDLAAILVPVALLGTVCEMGVGAYVARAAARGVSPARLLGTFAGLLSVAGLVMAALALPVVPVFTDDPTVRRWLVVGLLLLPLNLTGGVISSLARGLEQWRPWALSRLLYATAIVAGVVALAAADTLRAGTVAALIAAASALAMLPFAPLLHAVGRPRFARDLIRPGLRFGVRAWLANLGGLNNERLEQAILAALVSARELGLFAVSFDVANVSLVLSASLGTALLPRLAAGQRDVLPRAVRTTLGVVAAGNLAFAVVAPVVLPLVLGDKYADAVPVVWVLLLAAVPLAGIVMLGPALVGFGRPGSTALAEGCGLALTAGGLLVVLPLGAGVLGAALVALSAYSVCFALLLVSAVRHVGFAPRDYLFLRRGDLAWVWAELRRRSRSPRAQGVTPAPTPIGTSRPRQRPTTRTPPGGRP